MAKYARDLVEANGFSDVIEVIQSSVESVELPEKVRNGCISGYTGTGHVILFLSKLRCLQCRTPHYKDISVRCYIL